MDDEPELLQLTDDDVQSELDYWQQAVMGFFVGANPPWQILEGFLKRIWNKYVIDKISFLPYGVFLARFQTEEMKQSVLNSGYFLFDNKPLIIKPWQPDLQLTKENIKAVPAWIRMQNLPLKFWGKSLPIIANLLGHYVKSDPSTEMKTRLGFARVMVELKLGQTFPKSIKFLDEKKQEVTIDIVYEWKPSLCKHTVTVQTGTKDSPVTKSTEVVQDTLKTPETRIPVSSSGTLSPVRHPRQGSGQVSRKIATYPHGMGQLKENSSPKIDIGVNETKIKAMNLHNIVNKIFSDWSVSTNNALHHGGRVWVIWKPQVFDITFIKYDAQFIHVHVTNKIIHMKFYLTVIYAFNGVGERESLWMNLKNIARQIDAPWAIGGDFNCVLQANERLGGRVTEAESDPFYDCIQECGVMDIAAIGAFYTWNNKQPPETRVYSRLDKWLVNQDWLDNFPE
ncbi:uncharacterized protein LOC141629164 [Silene latifolia]|uniref:uncharacterized protein LOC141629164 n=1 Tax=Silene latifolia TaxID=37657 RepID=UPI003D771402